MSRSAKSRIKAVGISGALNVAMALSSPTLIAYGALLYNPIATGKVTYDYFAWASTLLALLAAYRELRRLRDRPLYSSAMLLVSGGVFVIEGRLLSLYCNGTFMLGYFGGLVGSYYTVEGYAASTLILFGSLMIALATLVHVVKGDVLAIKERPRLGDAYAGLALIAHRMAKALEKRPALVALIAGAFAFTYRFVPELRWWPWLIGWDTPEYVAHLMDFAERPNPFASYYWMGGLRNTPPLLVTLLYPFTFVVDAWTIFKVYPSVAYALLAALSALIAVAVYGKSWRVGLLAGLLTTLFVLNLRISWDYQRQLLGSVVMLATLLALEKWREPRGLKQAVATALLLIACGLSMEVTGLVGLALSLALIYAGLRSRNALGVASGLVGLAANASLEIWYWRRPYSVVEVVGVLPPGLVVSHEASQVVSYLVAGYGIVLPLALVAMAKHKRPYVTAAMAALLLAGVSPLITPYSSVTTWYRFLIGVAPLASTLSAIGLVEASRNRWVVLLYVLVASLPGLALAYGYNWSQDYSRALREFPSTLTPSPIGGRFLKTLEFFKENTDLAKEAVVIAEPNHAKYVHLAVRNHDPSKLVWTRSPSVTDEAVYRLMKSAGVEKAVLVAVNVVNASQASTGEREYALDVRPVSDELPWICVAQVRRIGSADEVARGLSEGIPQRS